MRCQFNDFNYNNQPNNYRPVPQKLMIIKELMYPNLLLTNLLKASFSSQITIVSPLKLRLIRQSLPYVHKYGWSDTAIHAACQQMGWSPASHRLIRPYDMISYCMRKWSSQSLRKIDDGNFQGNVKIRDKVHYAIKTRLQKQIQYIDSWNQAMAIGAHPQNVSQTKEILWQYSDQIWRRCGDTSTDYNYYSKRILFNTAYATTQLHMLTDQSINKNESWKFLQRRIQDILQFGKGINDIKTVGGAAFDGLFNLVTAFRQPPAELIRNPINQQKYNSVASPTPENKNN